ncbi:putative fasciclin-like arabinogalactan protein 20 isoform X2 [Solanum dulcamara]|uniref:putative fasciclin-like arabinogalactan protein 20 isoform X2 n=1 Tax=Solanum dulcamara TaxID=45834 RepID=UPI0024865DD5|nr:putative fasciclin-like arabinogalactan protein 20 isoform X2 [Solanum dulcamara]
MAFFKAFFFFFSYLLCFSTAQSPPPPPAPPQSLLNAAETLSNSGYISMSLTLELITDTVLSRAAKNSLTGSALTIFSPPDSSFTDFGQPSLSHILLHFSPVSISLSSLQSLPFSSKIPSLSPSSSLYVTSSPSDSRVSINNVEIVGSPIYDDGFVVVFAIEHFFTQNFTKPETNRNPDFKPSPQCISDWLVVHGLQSLIPLPDEIDDEMDEDPGKPERMIDVSIAPDHSEF